MSNPLVDSLLEFVRSEGRICPMPTAWAKLHQLLGDGAPVPAILGGWQAPPERKRAILEAQIWFAVERGLLPKVDRYLRTLPPDAWFGYRKTMPSDE